MPPPKKPKNGPTSVEQFLSQEELKYLGKDSRRQGQRTWDAASGAQGKAAGDPVPASSSSSSSSSQREPDPSAGPATSTSSPCSSRDTSPSSVGQTSPVQSKLSVSALLLAQNPSSLLADQRSSDPSSHSTSTSSTKYLKTPPELLSTSFLVTSSSLLPAATPASPVTAFSSSSTPTVTGGSVGGSSGGGTPYSMDANDKSAAAASGDSDVGSGGNNGGVGGVNINNNNNSSGNKASGSILHKLFASRPTENILTDESSAFREQLQHHLHQAPQKPLWHPGMVNATIGQPQVYTSDSRLANLGFRFPTSSNLASLMTRPAWLNFDHSRHLGAAGQTGPLGILRPVSGLDMQGLHSAATLSGMQHHHHQQQQQQQQQPQLDGRSIVASMISTQLNSGSPDPSLSSPSSSDDVFMGKSAPSSRGSNAPSYLSSLIIRQPLPLHAKSVRGGASGSAYTSGSRSESAQVYLQTFQLPPSTTSGIRKNKSTSSLPFLHSAPVGNNCLSGLPPLDNAKMFPVRTSPVNQAQPHAQPIITGNKHTVSSNINTTTPTDKNNSSSISSGSSISFHTTSVKNDIANYDSAGVAEPFDLSLKTSRLSQELKGSKDSTATSPSRKSSPYPLTGQAENSPASSSGVLQRSPSTSETATVAMESDEDSNSDINVTSPVPPCTLLRALSQPTDSFSISTSAVEGGASSPNPSSAPSSLRTLLSTNTSVPSPDPGPATTVKEEVGASIVPYDNKLPCKQETFAQPYPSSDGDRSG